MITSNAKCVLPWVHVCVRSNTTLKPCCRYIRKNITSTVTLDDVAEQAEDALNSEHLIALRKTMLKNEWDPGCIKCFSQEKNGRPSMRTVSNERYAVDEAALTENFDSVQYIEMSIDNLCNLQCRMCDSSYSSKLQPRDKFLNNIVYKKLQPNFRKFDKVSFDNLKWVKILGGEPFISPNFIEFLDYLIEKGDPSQITIEIATNATTIPDQKLVDKLNLFKGMHISISLDSMHKNNNYQRVGSDYETTYHNSLYYTTIFKSLKMSYHCTISILTANTFETLITQLINNEAITFDFVRDPPHLSLLCVPPAYFEWLYNELTEDYAKQLIHSIEADHNYNAKNWNLFLNETAKLDQYYNMKMEDYNPSLYKFLKKWNY